MAAINVRRAGGGGGGEVELGAELEAIAALAPPDDDLIQRKGGVWTNRTPEQIKTDLNITEYTPDADLVAIAALTPADDDLIQRKGGAWTNRTPAQVKADLGIAEPGPASPFTLNAGSTVIVPVDVADSWVVGANQIDRDTAVGTAEDSRILFNKAKGAFRAGTTTGTQWNDASQGTNSSATGMNTIASGTYSHAEGSSTLASGYASHAQGASCTASGAYSHASGASAQASRSSQHSLGVSQYGQCNRFAGQATTTDATPKLVLFNTDPLTLTGEMTNVLTIPVNRAHQFRVSVVARRYDVSGDAAGWVFEGLVARGSSGNAALIGTTDARAWSSGAGSAAWDVTLTIDTSNSTNNYLAITATGEAAKSIRWVASIETTEVG
jgi:hypothetical protein